MTTTINKFAELISLTFIQGELNNILNKVKNVINENEALIEQTKLSTITSDSSESESNDLIYRIQPNERHEKTALYGPNIVFESRISELEAQLAQAEIDIKNLSQETNSSEIYKRQIEALQRYVRTYHNL